MREPGGRGAKMFTLIDAKLQVQQHRDFGIHDSHHCGKLDFFVVNEGRRPEDPGSRGLAMRADKAAASSICLLAETPPLTSLVRLLRQHSLSKAATGQPAAWVRQGMAFHHKTMPFPLIPPT